MQVTSMDARHRGDQADSHSSQARRRPEHVQSALGSGTPCTIRRFAAMDADFFTAAARRHGHGACIRPVGSPRWTPV